MLTRRRSDDPVARDEAVRHRGAGARDAPAAGGAAGSPLDAGNLRHIRLDGVEAIRAISYIVRDRNWGTYNPEISNLSIEQDRRRLPRHLRRGLPRRAAGFAYRATHRGRRFGQSHLRRRRRGAQRFRHQPHRLRRPAPVGRRQRRAGRDRARRRQRRAQPLPRADRPDLPVHGHPRPDPRALAGRARRLPHGGRHLRDGGPAQLDGRLLQDLCPPAGAALALHRSPRASS